MGIIGTLLTGGCILGKICQTIKDANVFSLDTADGARLLVRAGEFEINGVRFVQTSEGEAGSLCAFNTDVDRYACVSCPNDGQGAQGFQVFIPPAGTEILPLGDWDALSPDLPFYVQKLDLREGAAVENNRVLVAFENLSLDGADLEMPNTRLKAEMDSLEIFFATAGLGDLESAQFTSPGGVRAVLRQPVPFMEKGDNVTAYAIPFEQLGFCGEDVLSGVLRFGLSQESTAALKRVSDSAAAQNGLDEVSGLMRRLCGIREG